jgi:hypothetical protein
MPTTIVLMLRLLGNDNFREHSSQRRKCLSDDIFIGNHSRSTASLPDIRDIKIADVSRCVQSLSDVEKTYNGVGSLEELPNNGSLFFRSRVPQFSEGGRKWRYIFIQ